MLGPDDPPLNRLDLWLNVCKVCQTHNPSIPRRPPEFCAGCGKPLETEFDARWLFGQGSQTCIFTKSGKLESDAEKLARAREFRRKLLELRARGKNP